MQPWYIATCMFTKVWMNYSHTKKLNNHFLDLKVWFVPCLKGVNISGVTVLAITFCRENTIVTSKNRKVATLPYRTILNSCDICKIPRIPVWYDGGEHRGLGLMCYHISCCVFLDLLWQHPRFNYLATDHSFMALCASTLWFAVSLSNGFGCSDCEEHYLISNEAPSSCCSCIRRMAQRFGLELVCCAISSYKYHFPYHFA